VAEIASITRTGHTVTIALLVDADFSVVTALLDTFEQARTMPDVRRIVVDLAAVRFMDSPALSAFVTAFRFARQDGMTFEVVNPSRSVGNLLAMTGVAHLFAAADDDPDDSWE
jgi:anti-anti-sigma factor